MILLLLLLACGDQSPAVADTGPVSVDGDGDGWASDVDCDDADPAIHPDAAERCNQVDDDCDGRIDQGLPLLQWYLDLDADGYGAASTQVTTCLTLDGYVSLGTDCDDGDASRHPAAVELCDGIDQDCDGEVDEDLPLLDFWLDLDEDGYGDPDGRVETCGQPEGFVDNGDDCDDDDPTAYPEAEEDWTDRTDSDCDGQVETAGPVTLTGGEVEQLHLSLPEGTALRVISVQGPGEVELSVDLGQPARLVLIGADVSWVVDDVGGTLEESVIVDADAVATTLDHPLFVSQRAAVEDVYGDIASWHGTTGLSLILSDLDAWPERNGWADCEAGWTTASLPPAARGALDCPELGTVACLTATEDALVAVDLAGDSCTVQALEDGPAGGTLVWSEASALLAVQPHGVLARVDLVSGRREQAWLWPEALLQLGDDALLVPGAHDSGFSPDIAYLYEGWNDLQCGSGANLTTVWADDLSVSTLAEGVSWWPQDGALLTWDLAAADGRTVAVAELSDVRGISPLPDGTVAVLVEGGLWVVEPASGAVRQTVDLDIDGHGLACAGM